MTHSWTRLVRFVDDNGSEKFGEPIVDTVDEIFDLIKTQKLYATEYKGQSLITASEKGDKIRVKELLDLVRPADVPIIRCIGLNYIKHSKFPASDT